MYTKILHRRSIRLPRHDYSQPGYYFVTICVQNMKHLFGEIKNCEMKLNERGQIAYNEWLNTKHIRNNLENPYQDHSQQLLGHINPP